jgi:hypothetical protein
MMQTFRISDALRCILLNAPRGPNLACPKENFPAGALLQVADVPLLPRNIKLWKEALTRRQNRVTLVWWEGTHLVGLASARSRIGLRIWEIDHLYLIAGLLSGEESTSDSLLLYLELLEHLVQAVGERRAERIFLRLSTDSPVIDLARRTGFFPYFEESLLMRGRHSERSHAKEDFPLGHLLQGGDGKIFSLWHRVPADDYGLFQLFSAATPSQARVALGLTFDQWRDGRERPSHGHAMSLARGRREWVVRCEGNACPAPISKIIGWLSLLPYSQGEEGDVMVHPDHPELLPVLLNLALGKGNAQRWLVPDYQKPVSDLLCHHGFRKVAHYTMLVKTVAARVKSRGMIPVEA